MTVQALPQRSEVPVEMTWDLSALFASEQAWEEAFKKVGTYPERLTAYKGRLRRSGRILLEFYKLSEECSQLARRVNLYASLHADEDTRNSHYKALVSRCQKLGTAIAKAKSWVDPELISIKPERLASFIAKTPGLEIYKHDFAELARERAHVLSPELEQVLSLTGEVGAGPSAIYGSFNNADLELPVLDDGNGAQVKLSKGNFSTFLDSPKREVRQAAYEAMFGAYNKMRNTLSATYSAQVNMDIFRARSRNYPSCLEQALSGNNIPVSVYNTLIDTVHANLPVLQRYMDLRKRILGVDELKWYDLYVPLVGEVNDKISYAEAQETALAALAPLGDDYVERLRQGFRSRWIDVIESEGKRSGAYHAGVWGSNPYMLLNWQDNIDSMFTLIHEAGHAMHSDSTKRNQPYTYSGYTIFVAEVASTTNEALLAHYLLSKTTDPKMRLHIINHQLESVRSTLIRQTLFAEFERDTHAHAEAGQALTPDFLCSHYLGLVRKYYASTSMDDIVGTEWMRIPHFYRPFYVYQYATGLSSALALARGILQNGEPAVARYRNFLNSGSSDYSLNLLKGAGVDLSTPAPIQAALDTFGEYVSLFEAEYAKL